MKKLIFIMMMTLGSSLVAQTNFTTTGNWSNAANWSAGIPDSTDNVSINFGQTATVDGVGECFNLSQFFSSISINNGASLTVHGLYSASTTTNANTNNGTLILKGGLKPAVGTQVLTIGGAVTFEGGVTFPNFTIE